MKILIEGHDYSNFFKDIINSLDIWKKEGKIDLIGYFYHKDIDDCVFLLPKVILNEEGKVFKRYSPEQLWDIDLLEGDLALNKYQQDFIYRFSIWIYQSINIFNQQNKDNDIVKKQTILNIDSSTEGAHVSYIDIILALVRFSEENKSFLLFKMSSMSHNNGIINWQKTISKSQPILRRDKFPFYLNPIIKKKDIDYEEELLVIYFSILHHINIKYGFKAGINPSFNLISQDKFNDYLKGLGLQRLQEIRYKYYSDKTLQIWNLCNLFFSQTNKVYSSHVSKDYLLTSTYNKIFETMVDYLIGETQEKLPNHIRKAQKDGKEIDHIFPFDSLIDDNLLSFYIVDSKYYKTEETKDIMGTSLFKQYTYVRNLLQDDLQWRRDHPNWGDHYFVCRDDKTEGYNIIPNYFLSAYINQDLRFDIHGIKPRNKYHKVYHFPNRLFDRETLMIFHYDINFLFVLEQYVCQYNNDIFRNNIRSTFRSDLLKHLNDLYIFYTLNLKIKPSSGNEIEALDAALTPIFRFANGKMICPQKDKTYTTIILALQNPNKCENETTKRRLITENTNVIESVKQSFTLKSHKLGDPITVP